jgi:hypothetical protein
MLLKESIFPLSLYSVDDGIRSIRAGNDVDDYELETHEISHRRPPDGLYHTINIDIKS